MHTVAVIIPTHNHAYTLPYAVRSVQQQHYQNFRLIVVGDGADEITARVMSNLCAEDCRIEYRPFEKGLGHGEASRDAVLANLDVPNVCYLGDDDLWLPNHLDTMVRLLASHDFVHTLHTPVYPDGSVHCHGGRLDDPATRESMQQEKWNIFGPTCAGHTLSAYRRLPFGWRPKPEGLWSDLYMWRQWITLPNCKFHSHPLPTTLHFPSSLRQNFSVEARQAEIGDWAQRITDPAFPQILLEMVMADWQVRLTPWPIKQDSELERLTKTLADSQEQIYEYINANTALKQSLSWRITAPLRLLTELVWGWHNAVRRKGKPE